ncbi:MAG: alpha/beta hydrolase family protein [Lachnospiraceae bacterium]|nr:alpha/beta hydrolase family protein [Lachnospiraceae bacterium]
MALLQCNLFSGTLCFGTDINVIIPSPDSDDILHKKNISYFHKGVKFPVLYLLHGAYGDYSDWLRLSKIEAYANEHKMIVIMPSASNSFYQDMEYGSDYETYMTEELPAFAQQMFPMLTDREHTFIGGLSMGGYGALKLAFDNPDKYGACISLSGALDIQGVYEDIREGRMEAPFLWDAIFSDPERIQGSDKDLFELYKIGGEQGCIMPRIFQSCGTEDFIYHSNLGARDRLMEMGADLTYEEHPGIHDWNYWDANIGRAMEWLIYN